SRYAQNILTGTYRSGIFRSTPGTMARFRFSLCLPRPSHSTRKVRAPEGCEYSLTAQGGFAEVLGLAAELCELMTPVTGPGQQPARASPPAGPLRRRVRSMPGCQGEG